MAFTALVHLKCLRLRDCSISIALAACFLACPSFFLLPVLLLLHLVLGWLARLPSPLIAPLRAGRGMAGLLLRLAALVFMHCLLRQVIAGGAELRRHDVLMVREELSSVELLVVPFSECVLGLQLATTVRLLVSLLACL